jgi:hypothetical protein
MHLTFVDCGMSPRNGGAPVLFLACCASKIYFYPHAYNHDKNFRMERLVLAFSNFYNYLIFSIVNMSMSNCHCIAGGAQQNDPSMTASKKGRPWH